jgi:hypothetical protein
LIRRWPSPRCERPAWTVATSAAGALTAITADAPRVLQTQQEFRFASARASPSKPSPTKQAGIAAAQAAQVGPETEPVSEPGARVATPPKRSIDAAVAGQKRHAAEASGATQSLGTAKRRGSGAASSTPSGGANKATPVQQRPSPAALPPGQLPPGGVPEKLGDQPLRLIIGELPRAPANILLNIAVPALDVAVWDMTIWETTAVPCAD